MNPNSASTQNYVIPAKAGIQQEQKFRKSDKTVLLPRYAGAFLITWIPACAGMTDL
jgi:hypothetical protein